MTGDKKGRCRTRYRYTYSEDSVKIHPGRMPYEDAGFGVMHVQAKECQRLPANHRKLGRGQEGLPYRL